MIDKYLSEIVPGKASRTQDDYRAYCTKLKHSLGHMLPDEIGITDLYDYHRPTGLRLAMLLSGVISRRQPRSSSTNKPWPRSHLVLTKVSPQKIMPSSKCGWQVAIAAQRSLTNSSVA